MKLLNDQAIHEGPKDVADGLGFSTYSEILANAALGTPGPFTVGVYGDWGTGKTSLLRMVEARLSESENVIPVWFNAWRYEQDDHPVVPLIATIKLQNWSADKH